MLHSEVQSGGRRRKGAMQVPLCERCCSDSNGLSMRWSPYAQRLHCMMMRVLLRMYSCNALFMSRYLLLNSVLVCTNSKAREYISTYMSIYLREQKEDEYPLLISEVKCQRTEVTTRCECKQLNTQS